MSHYVYRCYDADGLLLYVGSTSNMKRRMAQHRKGQARASKTLSALMATYATEGPYMDRVTAEAAEQAAIATERPLLNTHHSGTPRWIGDRVLEDYLKERGLPPSLAGLHYCKSCGTLRGYHMTGDLCSDCRFELADTA